MNSRVTPNAAEHLVFSAHENLSAVRLWEKVTDYQESLDLESRTLYASSEFRHGARQRRDVRHRTHVGAFTMPGLKLRTNAPKPVCLFSVSSSFGFSTYRTPNLVFGIVSPPSLSAQMDALNSKRQRQLRDVVTFFLEDGKKDAPVQPKVPREKHKGKSSSSAQGRAGNERPRCVHVYELYHYHSHSTTLRPGFMNHPSPSDDHRPSILYISALLVAKTAVSLIRSFVFVDS